jgi:hypothetical protein
MRRILSAVVAAVAAVASAHAQTFVNNYMAGGAALPGWTDANTANGVGAPGTTAVFDIDGPGPLAANAAAKFHVGQAVFAAGVQEGITMTQALWLPAGFVYTIDIDVAAENTQAVSNAEGGRFALIVQGGEFDLAAAGSIAAGTSEFFHLHGSFITGGTGIFNIGVKITRPFLNPAGDGLSQYADNFTVRPASFDNGDLEASAASIAGWSVVNTANGVGAPGTIDVFDIDGGGPLAATNAAKFAVGQAVFASGVQEGIEMTQSVRFANNRTYRIEFDWAAVNTNALSSNAQGGVFNLIIDGVAVATESAPNIAANSSVFGHVSFNYASVANALHGVGVRITRPFLVPGGATPTLFQYVDNFTISGGGMHVETSDAGDLPATAQVVPGNDLIQGISGTIAVSGADMYRISICDQAHFGAATVGNTDFDSQLFLFGPTGLGVTADDDDPTLGTLQSRITSVNVVANGIYYLAISSFDHDPVSVGGEIFADAFAVEHGPDGPGGASPITGWAGAGGSSGPYGILVSGVCGGQVCYADCNMDNALNVNDFVCFQAQFAAATPYADCNHDNALNVNDFVCFQAAFAAGCP